MLNKKKYFAMYLLFKVLSILLSILPSMPLPRDTTGLLFTGNHRFFLPEQLPSLVSLFWIHLRQVLNSQLSFWIFIMFLTTQPSTCIGPHKRTGNPLIIPKVPKVQFQLHTRWGYTLFPLINIQSTFSKSTFYTFPDTAANSKDWWQVGSYFPSQNWDSLRCNKMLQFQQLHWHNRKIHYWELKQSNIWQDCQHYVTLVSLRCQVHQPHKKW